MYKILKYSFAIIATMLTITSCEDALFGEDKASDNPTTNFEYYWQQVNDLFSFFDIKQVNWDSVKTAYAPRITDDMTDDSLFTVLGSMTEELKDAHSALSYDFGSTSYRDLVLGTPGFDFNLVVDKYVGRDMSFTGLFRHDFIQGENIGYIYFGSFRDIEDANLDYVLNRYKDTKGLIFDLRQNSGGASSEISVILSRFIKEKTLVMHTQYRNGPKHDDFSDFRPIYIEPYKGDGITYDKKVIVLTDIGTYSSGSLMTLAVSAIPHITTIGESTGGGISTPVGGALPNGWIYSVSATRTTDFEKKHAEYENGVPPDIYVKFDRTNPFVDEILERAIEELR